VRHRVPGMVAGLNKVIEREKSGVYPGGPNLRKERYAVLGAPVFFWIKSACTARLYGAAIGILARGWPMFLATCAQKISSALHGRGKIEVLPFEFKPKGTGELQSQNATASSAVPVR
jgi:hypothetical protein